MPSQKKSRQGSNSTAAKLISRANSSKTLNHSLCNNSEYPSNAHGATSNHENNNHTIENYGDGLTAKQQQQLERNAFLDTQTKDQLKQECRRRGQKTTGNKTELV
jgi:SAP domain